MTEVIELKQIAEEVNIFACGDVLKLLFMDIYLKSNYAY